MYLFYLRVVELSFQQHPPPSNNPFNDYPLKRLKIREYLLLDKNICIQLLKSVKCVNMVRVQSKQFPQQYRYSEVFT